MITGRNMNVIAVLKVIPWREHAMAGRHRMHGAHAAAAHPSDFLPNRKANK